MRPCDAARLAAKVGELWPASKRGPQAAEDNPSPQEKPCFNKNTLTDYRKLAGHQRDGSTGEGRPQWGDKYEQAIALFNRSYDTLRKYKAVGRQIELGRRRPNLSFKHHQEVAYLPAETQDALLDRAEPAGEMVGASRRGISITSPNRTADRTTSRHDVAPS